MDNKLLNLEKFLLSEIPITRHLGLSVASYEDGCLTLNAPLDENSNHISTVFAGSLNAVMTLAGLGQFWLMLKEYGYEAQIVIQNSVVEYVRPVTKSFGARCLRPEASVIENMIKSLSRKGRARLQLTVEVVENGQRAVRFAGRYVATLS
jgi:thioesterase domain-containing protein